MLQSISIDVIEMYAREGARQSKRIPAQDFLERLFLRLFLFIGVTDGEQGHQFIIVRTFQDLLDGL